MRQVGQGRRRPPRRATWFYFPRSHRLFAVFADRAQAGRALQAVEGARPGKATTWFFEGKDGATELDPDALTGLGRGFSWLFSSNIEVLRELSGLVRDGAVVVAVPEADVASADRDAAILRQHGGQWFAYTAHGNFVPVAPVSTGPKLVP